MLMFFDNSNHELSNLIKVSQITQGFLSFVEIILDKIFSKKAGRKSLSIKKASCCKCVYNSP